jgi:hypothetical protein
VPLEVLRIEDAAARAVYGDGSLLLVRPDGHVAWRGRDALDARRADAALARILGWPAEA